MDNNNKFSSSVTSFVNKATVIGKKAATDISTGAKNISEYTKKTLEEQRRKKYNPLFTEAYFSESFRIPKVIEIVDASVRSNIDVCDGAIGWTDKINDVEVLHIYDSFIADCRLSFVPYAKCDTIYCVDNFDKTIYISIENIFERATNEKLAELENVAYSLGAKSCSVEIIESSLESSLGKFGSTVKTSKFSESDDISLSAKNRKENRGTTVSYFEGNDSPQAPSLKWFAYDDSVKNLISMRCSENNSIKSKVLEFKGSASATMSQKTACAIDTLIKVKGSMSYEKQAIKEHSSKLIFAIEF